MFLCCLPPFLSIISYVFLCFLDPVRAQRPSNKSQVWHLQMHHRRLRRRGTLQFHVALTVDDSILFTSENGSVICSHPSPYY